MTITGTGVVTAWQTGMVALDGLCIFVGGQITRGLHREKQTIKHYKSAISLDTSSLCQHH
jgi:hypothetical protein